jgi:hypothetical protein
VPWHEDGFFHGTNTRSDIIELLAGRGRRGRGGSPRWLAGHEGPECDLVVRVPARERRSVLGDVAGRPLDAAAIDLRRHVVVGTQDVEVAAGQRREQVVGDLPWQPRGRRLLVGRLFAISCPPLRLRCRSSILNLGGGSMTWPRTSGIHGFLEPESQLDRILRDRIRLPRNSQESRAFCETCRSRISCRNDGRLSACEIGISQVGLHLQGAERNSRGLGPSGRSFGGISSSRTSLVRENRSRSRIELPRSGNSPSTSLPAEFPQRRAPAAQLVFDCIQTTRCGTVLEAQFPEWRRTSPQE